MPTTLNANAPLPAITVPKVGGGTLTLGETGGGETWRMVIVYRGKHCPLCAKYFRELEDMLGTFRDLNVEVVAVSADPQEKADAFVADTGTSVPVGYDLGIDDMRALGLYISDPRSPQETDRPFAEPGLFLLRGDGGLQIVDVSNAPFSRPDLSTLAKGIAFVRDKDYPARGTH